jgi:hypothetical protein
LELVRWCAPFASEDAVVLRCSGARGDARCGGSDPLQQNQSEHQCPSENPRHTPPATGGGWLPALGSARTWISAWSSASSWRRRRRRRWRSWGNLPSSSPFAACACRQSGDASSEEQLRERERRWVHGKAEASGARRQDSGEALNKRAASPFSRGNGLGNLFAY